MPKILLGIVVGLAAAPAGAQTQPAEAPQSSFDRQFDQATSTNPLKSTSGPASGGSDYITPKRRSQLAAAREAKAAEKAAKAAAANTAAAQPPKQ